MFCIKCGQQLPDDARFCFKCGAATVQQNGVANSAQPFDDYVAAKAESFAAAGQHVTESHVPSQEYKPRYTETMELFLTDNLYKVKRKDNIGNTVTYSLLWDVEEQIQSDWFDNIWYAGYNIFLVKRGGWEGLMESSFKKVEYYDRMITVGDGLFGVYIDRHWTIVSIRDGSIKLLDQYSYEGIDVNRTYKEYFAVIVTQNGKKTFWQYNYDTDQVIDPLSCEFDDIQAYERCDFFIVRCGNKYGCVFQEGNTLYYPINCVLDAVSSAYFYGDKAEVKYNGKKFFMDKEGCLWIRRWRAPGEMAQTGIFVLLNFVAVGMATFLSGRLFNELPLSEGISFICMLVMLVMIVLACNKIIYMVLDLLCKEHYTKTDIDLRKVEE